MKLCIKKMETEAEMVGKAYVHYRSWQEAYKGLVDQSYLDALTLDKCMDIARRYPDNVLVALDEDNVVGFVAYGGYRNADLPLAGEVFAIYVLSDYFGKGVGLALMHAALDQLGDYPQVAVWVLKDNARTIAFYRKCGFAFDGTEQTITLGTPVSEVRMILTR